jgi:hypothetical protein
MIYLIFTASIINKDRNSINKNDNLRSMTYINSIKKTLSFLPSNIVPIIVENNGKRETELDSLGIKVCYTNNNDNMYWHKGVNELLDIQHVINEYNINDEDIIIKITGRYHLLNNNFINLIINNINDYDAFVKFFNICTQKYEKYDSVLGLFAVRCKILKSLNYNNITESPEVQFSKHIRNNIHISRIKEIDTLYLRCVHVNHSEFLDI